MLRLIIYKYNNNAPIAHIHAEIKIYFFIA